MLMRDRKLQQSSEIPQKLLRLVEVDVDNLGNEVGRSFILKLLQLQELLIQYSLQKQHFKINLTTTTDSSTIPKTPTITKPKRKMEELDIEPGGRAMRAGDSCRLASGPHPTRASTEVDPSWLTTTCNPKTEKSVRGSTLYVFFWVSCVFQGLRGSFGVISNSGNGSWSWKNLKTAVEWTLLF